MKRIYVYSMYARRGKTSASAANALWVDDDPGAEQLAKHHALMAARHQFPPNEGWEEHGTALTNITDDFLYQAGWVRR